VIADIPAVGGGFVEHEQIGSSPNPRMSRRRDSAIQRTIGFTGSWCHHPRRPGATTLAHTARSLHTDSVDLTWMSVRAGWRRLRASSFAIVVLIGFAGG